MTSKIFKAIPILLAVFACVPAASAQTLDISWYTIDGGGGTSTGGTFTLRSTIGQHDAGDLSGGTFVLRGGFWQTPAPTCFSSTAPALQRQFDPVTGDLTGAPEPKMRFLSVWAGDPGVMQTIRVTWIAMPNWPGGYADLVGQKKWMTEPFQVCENSGQSVAVTPPDCGPAPGQPQRWLWAAELTCNPELAWSGDLTALRNYCSRSGEACAVDGDCAAGTCGVDGVVHLFDPGIAPSRVSQGTVVAPAEYSVQVIHTLCALDVEAAYSDPLITRTAGWGDLVGVSISCPSSLPNNSADLVPDVIESIRKFSNESCAPKKTRVEVDNDFFYAYATDLLSVLNAFSAGGDGFDLSDSEDPVTPCPAGP